MILFLESWGNEMMFYVTFSFSEAPPQRQAEQSWSNLQSFYNHFNGKDSRVNKLKAPFVLL